MRAWAAWHTATDGKCRLGRGGGQRQRCERGVEIQWEPGKTGTGDQAGWHGGTQLEPGWR